MVPGWRGGPARLRRRRRKRRIVRSRPPHRRYRHASPGGEESVISPEAVYLAAILAVALVFFYTGWLRTDVTALLVLVALMVPWRPQDAALVPILTAQQAFSGFGSPALIMVASMFVLSTATVRTGAAHLLGARILGLGSGSELRFQITVLLVTTLFSAVINDTTTVLIWMPMVVAVCRERGYAPGRILILLAYASLLGGQWTLIGTRSNIIISDYLRLRTGSGLEFFDFTPVAALVLGACLLWFLLFGRRLLPRGAAEVSLAERYEVTEYLTELMATPHSELVGRTLGEIDFADKHDVSVIQVIRAGEMLPPSPWLRVFPDDVLVIQGKISRITQLLKSTDFQVKEELKIDDKTLRSVDLRMAEAVVAPNTDLEGKTLEQLDFMNQYGVSVLAIDRRGKPATGRPVEQELAAGDSLLLVGHESDIRRLRSNPNVLLLESRPLPVTNKTKARLVIGLMAAMVLVSATGLLEPAVAIPLTALLAVLTRCVGMRDAYESLDLQALVVVGAMIPFGLALEETGTAHALAQSVAGALEDAPPRVLFGALLLLAVLLTQLVENAAVAILLSPVAYELAVTSGADPVPYLLGLAICVSAAFMSPVAHESTLLVMGPGQYRFRDYLLLGTPFALLTWATTTAVLPLFWPL